MIAAWLSVALAAGPISLGECEDPVRTSIERFEEMIVTAEPAAEVAFADCLVELGLYHSAQRHYLEASRMRLEGMPSDPWMRALDRAMALVDELGDPHSVAAYVRGVEPRGVKLNRGRNAMYLVHGLNLIGEGRYELAAVRLEEVDPESVWGQTALLAQARALDLAGRIEPALALYASVDDPRMAEDALTRRAVLLEESGRLDEALRILDELEALPGESGFAATARVHWLVRAGRQEEAEAAARQALHLASEGAYVPDGDLVAAEVAVHDCKVRRARRHIARYRDRWDPVQMALDVAVNVGKVDGGVVYEQYFGEETLDWGLPESVIAHVTGPDRERGEVQQHLARIETEATALDAIEGDEFQAIVAPHLRRVLEDGQMRLRFLVGEGVLTALAGVHGELAAHGAQADRLEERAAECR